MTNIATIFEQFDKKYLPLRDDNWDFRLTELSDNYLRSTAEKILEKICAGIYSKEELLPLTDCLTSQQKSEFYLICSELESDTINQENSIDMLWEKGDSQLRTELKSARTRIKSRVKAVAQLCKYTQAETDHSIRGSIHYINKYVEKNQPS